MLSAHVPVCTRTGTAQEGWRWGDTGELIRLAQCEGLTPQCRSVGSKSEGWYADGLIAWDMCAATARVHLEGEACGPSIGYSCDAARYYCQGSTAEGTKGGSGVCRPFGSCSANADCAVSDNVWSHDNVPGAGVCVDSQCTWVREDCRSTADCQDGLSCVGIPSDRSTAFGKCRSTERLPTEDSACSAALPCEAGLSCVGLTMAPEETEETEETEGWCLPSWMVASYTNDWTYGTTSNVVAYGLATVPVDIVVRAKLNKQSSSNWILTLTDPNGIKAEVCSPTTTPCTAKNLAKGLSVKDNSRDDRVNGRWTLQVLGSGSPKIRQWTLNLSSRWD